MKRRVLMIMAVCLMVVAGCSGDKGKQQLETAQFEEKQNNREHAIKLYEEIISKYPRSPNARIAEERLAVLKGGK